jgi:hypothetical protein
MGDGPVSYAIFPVALTPFNRAAMGAILAHNDWSLPFSPIRRSELPAKKRKSGAWCAPPLKVTIPIPPLLAG